MRFLVCIFAALCLGGCASDSSAPFKIGVDATWYPVDFEDQTAYVNGFVEDLLLEMAWHGRFEWEKVSANSDSLLLGMKQKKYDAVLTSLPRYTFNLAKYDFSENFLNLGPVLVVDANSPYKKLENIKEGVVGAILGSSFSVEIEKNPMVQIRFYPTAPELLSALEQGEVIGALLGSLTAENYVRDLYAGRLKIITKPLNEYGLHLIVEKGENQKLLKLFNTNLEWIKNKKMKSLLGKWGLTREH